MSIEIDGEAPVSASGNHDAARRRIERLAEVWKEFASNKSGLAGLIFLVVIIVLALCAPLIAPESLLDVTKIDNPLNAPPSWGLPLGTDPAGRSVLINLLWGSRTSLVVGFLSAALSVILGTLVGMAAGHFGGWISGILMRVIDFFLVLPSLVLAIVLASVMGRDLLTIIIAIGVTSWASTARVVRSQTLSVESQPYIERAWALGAGHRHVIFKHVLPAVMPLVMANTTLTIGVAIITESTLAFLGLSDPTKASWGTMLELATSSGAATAGYWWFVLSPGIAIVLVVLAFTLVGRAFEAVINPTLKGR
jgi:peptide/nickel transport system permease protein